MDIIKKADKEKKAKVVRSLSNSESYGIKNRTVSGKKILQEVRENNYWLRCDCKAKNNPTLAVKRRNDEYFLVHLNNREKHAKKCLLVESIDESSGSSASRLTKNTNICFHYAVRDTVSQPEEGGKGRESGSSERASTLYNLMCTLISDARINQVTTRDLTLSNQHDEIIKVAKKLKFSGNQSLDGFLWFNILAVDSVGAMLNTQRGDWLSNVRPHCLFIVTIDAVEGQRLIRIDGKVTTLVNVEGALSKPGRLGKRSGPYIAMFTVAESISYPGRFCAQRAFVMPVQSRTLLMPVDSDFERAVIKKILDGWISWWSDKGKTVTLTKPLFDIGTSNNRCRPDIILEVDKQKIIIEVMGSWEQDYIDRKKRVVPRMEKLGKVFEFDALSAYQSGKLDHEITILLKRVSVVILGGKNKV